MGVRVIELLDKEIAAVKEHLMKLEAVREMMASDPALVMVMSKAIMSPEANGPLIGRLSVDKPIPASRIVPDNPSLAAPSPTPASEPVAGSTEIQQVTKRGPNDYRYRLPTLIDYFQSKPAGHRATARQIAQETGLQQANIYSLFNEHQDLFDSTTGGERGSKLFGVKPKR
jgi:hypothetical protein